jgi:hypothetical protein
MPKYWFRQKRFGYGATPNSWQGWLLAIGSSLLAFCVVVVGPAIRDNGLRALWLTGGLTLVLVPTLLIVHAKTEGGWRWRNGRD